MFDPRSCASFLSHTTNNRGGGVRLRTYDAITPSDGWNELHEAWCRYFDRCLIGNKTSETKTSDAG
jgi:hypothetical protein